MSEDHAHDSMSRSYKLLSIDQAIKLDTMMMTATTKSGEENDKGHEESIRDGDGNDWRHQFGQHSSQGSSSKCSEEAFDIYKHRVVNAFTRLLVERHYQHIIDTFPFILPLASPHIDYDITNENDDSPVLRSRHEVMRRKGGSYNRITQLSLCLTVSIISHPHAHPAYLRPSASGNVVGSLSKKY
ncbi:MAG: hypothetical protein TREMPRED_001213 [Tremellales sp. Tagirdzhanova-0007]|nr:MAG: hypothetical protein TREMPRED_001213 [Tremellales sp. Tagirdzhanova-0007]